MEIVCCSYLKICKIRSQWIQIRASTDGVEWLLPWTDSGTSIRFGSNICICFLLLQTQLSPWAWYSSWYLFSAHHTHLFMNMCWVPFAGKKHFLLCHIRHTSWHNFIVYISCVSGVCLVWWKTSHRVSKTAGTPLWVWRSFSDSDLGSSMEKKRVR